jgi:hypothetical protein
VNERLLRVPLPLPFASAAAISSKEGTCHNRM